MSNKKGSFIMEKLQVINHPQFGELTVVVINGKEFFKAKEVAMMLGYKDTINAVKQHCKGVVKHHLLTKGGKQEVSLIPEGDVWRLIIRSKLPQAEAIEKWIMEEVLPTIRKTGTYTMPKQEKQLTFYEYFDKKWDGRIVMTIEDISHFVDIAKDSIRYCIKTYGKEGEDYYLLKKAELAKFKLENPKANKFLKGITVITRSGFELICKWYGIKIDYPDAFLRDMFSKRKAIEPPKQNILPVKKNSGNERVEMDDYITALRVLRSVRKDWQNILEKGKTDAFDACVHYVCLTASANSI